MNTTSLGAMHRSVASILGQRTAVRYKDDGIWRDLSWECVRTLADQASAALIRLGVERGDRIAILSENRAEWIAADQALLSAGAASVTMHAPLAPPQVAYQVSHSQAKGIIVSGADQAKKVFDVLDQLPELQFLVSFDPLPATMKPCRPLPHFTWQELIHSTRTIDNWRQIVADREATVQATDLATVIYTSGTTGNPKGVMLTHSNLLTNAASTAESGSYRRSDVILSWLPYSHIYARTVDLYLTMLTWGTLCVGGPVDALLADLAAVQPTWMTAVPRFYEKVWAIIEAIPEAEKSTQLRRIFGARLDHLSSGGAPLPMHLAVGFQKYGVPIYQGYGLTESSPVISFNNRQSNRPGSVGRPLPDVEVRIAEDGEILTRGPHVMRGYWRNPEATRETMVDDWLRTGDVGHLDSDGYLFITDRKKDLIVTSAGKKIAPAEIERLLISDPCVDQAVVFGDNRPFITALIVPNAKMLNDLLRQNGWSLNVENDFITSSDVCAFFEARIAAIMEQVSTPERVRKFLLLNRPLSQDRDELTPTLKVRRRFIVGQFEREFLSLYNT